MPLSACAGGLLHPGSPGRVPDRPGPVRPGRARRRDHGLRGSVGLRGTPAHRGRPYLHTLVASPPLTANASYYAQIVRDASMRRRFVEVGSRIVQTGFSGGARSRTSSTGRRPRCMRSPATTAEDYAPLSDLLDGVYTELESIQNHTGDIIGIPTGFIDLDKLTNGLHPGADDRGGTSRDGKVHPRLDFARSCSIKHGLTSAIFSLEMSRNEIVMRLLSAQGTAAASHAVRFLNEQQWTRMVNTMSTVSDAPLFIDDSPNMSMMEIRPSAAVSKAAARSTADHRRLSAVDEFGQAGGIPSAGGC